MDHFKGTEIRNKFNGNLIVSGKMPLKRLVQENKADLKEADLSGADLWGADLSGADLRGADFREACLCEADLSRADLRCAYLREVNLKGADLSKADLREVNFRKAYLWGANFTGADLREAGLRGVDLSGVNLRGTDFRGTNLSLLDLRDANLRGANLLGANLSGTKIKFNQFPSIRLLSSINLGELSDELTLELMRRDAYAHPHPERFNEWARIVGGSCPYQNEERFWFFDVRADLWEPGLPGMTDCELIIAICKEEGWEIEGYLE